jgi:outer membrane receptor protein involved in Fe transport
MSLLKHSVAALALLSTISAAHAQTADETSEETDSTDIIVTATRNATELSKVPISVSAMSGEALDKAGLRSIEDITRNTPGVNFSKGLGSTTSISIRGITSTAGAATTGVYLNDTPIQSRDLGQAGTFANAYPTIFDLERVEVLRGPQGTLFGAGSQGGTVRFITPQPNLDDVNVVARTELATTEGGDPSYEAGLAVGAPIVKDVLGFRVSAYYRRDGGYIDRVNHITGDLIEKNADWQESLALRGALTLAPVDAVKITPSVFYQDLNYNNKQAYWAYLTDKDDHDFKTGSQVREPTRDKMFLPALDVSIDLGFADLISNSSYLKRTVRVDQNFSHFLPALLGVTVEPGVFTPGFPEYASVGLDQNRQRAFSQEVRLQSNDNTSRLKWVVGVFYQHSRQVATEVLPDTEANFNAFSQALFGLDGEDIFGVPLANGSFNYTDATQFSYINQVTGIDKQLAAFADVTFELTDKLSVNAGLRYAKTRFRFDSFSDGPYNSGTTVASGRQKESPLTPKINVSYQADDDNLFYVTAAKGFRVGGANSPVATRCNAELEEIGYPDGAPASYGSDSVWSYEIGSKNALFDRKLRVATSVYMIDWSNIQQSVGINSCGLSFVDNLGKARSKGFDIALDLRATDTLSLQLSAGYTNAKYSETVLGGLDDDGNPVAIVRKGNRIGGTPWLVSAAVENRFDLGDRDLTARVDYQYRSANTRGTAAFDPTTSSFSPRAFQRPANHLVNARLTSEIGGVDVSLFVNNIFDTHPDLYRVQLSAERNLIDEFQTNRPRTFGVTASYRY